MNDSTYRDYLLVCLAFICLSAGLSGCTDDNQSDTDTPDARTDSTIDSSDSGENVLPTEYYRAVAISEAFDPSASSDQRVMDLGGRLLQAYLSGVRYSDDGGETWTTVLNPFMFPSESIHRELVLNELTNSVFVFSSSFRLYRSDDQGETFDELTSPFAINGSGVARQLVVGDDGAIWAVALRFQNAIDDYGLAVSTDDGETFDEVELPFELSEEDAIAASQGLNFFAGPSGSLFLNVNGKRLYRRTVESGWQLVDDIVFVLEHFVTETGVVLISFRDLNVYKLALSTDGGDTFDITVESDPNGYNDTFAELGDGTIVRVSESGRLRVLASDGGAWDEVISAYPDSHESPFVTGVSVSGNTLELSFEYERLRWTQGDDEWTALAPPPVIPIASRIVDITVTESGKAAVIVSKNGRGIIYVSDDEGETWRRGQRFDEGVLTLAMKPEGDMIFVGGVAGRYWLLDGDGFLPEDRDPSNASTGYDGFSLLQSVWTPKYGRNSYLLVVGANSEDTDGGLYRSTFYTELANRTQLDPLRDPQFPARDNPAGMRSVQYSGTSIAVGLRQHLGGLTRQDRLMVATTLSDWAETTPDFSENQRAVAFGTPLSMTSRTSDDCKMFGQLYSDGRLFNGAFPVEITAGFPVTGVTINDIECGPGGVWWIGTGGGLYRLERLPEPE